MTVAVTARTAGKVTLNVIGDRLITTADAGRAGRHRAAHRSGRQRLGHRRLCGGDAAPSARHARRAHARPRHRRAVVRRQPPGAHACGQHGRCRSCSARAATLRIPVKIGGLAAGEEARIVVAAVDVGILNLTNYKPPAPDDYYLGQRRLTADVRDLYGQLIDGMQGTRGQIKSGGDTAAAELQGSPPAQKPLALYSGLVTVRADGTAEVDLRHPGLRRHRPRDGGGLVARTRSAAP